MARLVREMMSTEPICLTSSTTLIDLAMQMSKYDIGDVLITENDRIMGVVTDRDIVIRVVAKGLDPKTPKLRDFGDNKPVSVRPDDDVSRARELMQQQKVQRILVCDDQGKAVGVISLQDLSRIEDDRELGQTVQQVKGEGAPVH